VPILDLLVGLDNLQGTQSCGPQSSSLNPQLYHSPSGRDCREPPSSSANLHGCSAKHSECGGFHQVRPIVTNSYYNVDFFIALSSPALSHGKLVECRRDTRIVLEIEVSPRSLGIKLPWDCIRIPRTKSVQRSATLQDEKVLDFRLEVQGATTGVKRNSLCPICIERETRNSSTQPTLVDFTSKSNTISLKSGKAKIAFRFLCLSTHHGITDSEYR